jgi:hypothetical protein
VGQHNGGSIAVFGYAFGEEAENPKKEAGLRILLWHRLTCLNRQPWPDAGAFDMAKIGPRLNKYDLVVTGDNHHQFTEKKIVNPGSLMRMTSDQCDFQPAVFGWRDDGSITRIPLPIKEGVVKVTAKSEKDKEARDVRMEAYIVRAKKQFEDRLSFEKNLEKHFAKNKERDGVRTVTWKAVETSEK